MHSRMWGNEGFMAIKVNISKEYDMVELRFLKVEMQKMGFEDKWVRLIMMCVSSANYAVLVNGTAMGNISPTKGIRQGDPISPCLFLLCANALSSLLARVERKGVLTGVPTSKKGPCLNYFFFRR
jgi:hypothetical protein